jgi:hypothetical protein
MFEEEDNKLVDEVDTDNKEVETETETKEVKEDSADEKTEQSTENSFEPKNVPLSALKAERQKRQEAQARLDKINQENQELSNKVKELEQELSWIKRKAEREGIEITQRPQTLTQEHIDKIRDEQGDAIADALEIQMQSQQASQPQPDNEPHKQNNDFLVEQALQESGLSEWRDLADSGIKEYQDLWNGIIETEANFKGDFNSLTERFIALKEHYIQSVNNKPTKEPHKTLSSVGEVIKDESLVDKFSKLSGKEWQVEYAKLNAQQKQTLAKELN